MGEVMGVGAPGAAQLAAVSTACTLVYGDRLAGVAVFGSVGRGTATDASDVDLLVVLRTRPGGRTACLEEFAAVEEELAAHGAQLDLSPVFRTVTELREGFALLLDMVDDARILYDAEGEVAAALARLRARLEELGAQRIPYKGSWYWDLKPDFQVGEIFRI